MVLYVQRYSITPEHDKVDYALAVTSNGSSNANFEYALSNMTIGLKRKFDEMVWCQKAAEAHLHCITLQIMKPDYKRLKS